MKFKRRAARWFGWLLLALVLGGCASASNLSFHRQTLIGYHDSYTP